MMPLFKTELLVYHVALLFLRGLILVELADGT